MAGSELHTNNRSAQRIGIGWDGIGWDNYLWEIEALKGLERLGFLRSVTFFAGENDSGKSILLEAVVVIYGFNPEGDTRNYSLSTYDSHSELCEALRVFRGYWKANWGYSLRTRNFYNVATKELEYPDSEHPSKKHHEKSRGESFLALAQSQSRANGVYLSDESEAALSPQHQLTLLVEVYKCARGDAQLIIVTHSPILPGMPEAEITVFDGGMIHSCEYEDTDSYQVIEMFINGRKWVLDRLLNSG